MHANPRLKRVWEGDPTIDEARPSPSFQPDPSASPPPPGSPARMCDINQLVDRRVLDGSEDLPEAPQQDVRMDEVLTPSQKCSVCYRGTSLIINTPFLAPYSRTIPRVLWWSQGLFLMSEVPL